jgi:hypothetical protein
MAPKDAFVRLGFGGSIMAKRKLSDRPKLTTKQAKAFLGSPGNALFWGWVAAGEITPIRVGERKVIWDPADLDAFLERKAAEGYSPNYTAGMKGHDIPASAGE